MKKNLSDYAVLNKGVISSELCDLTIKELEESNSLKQHIFTHYVDNKLHEYSRGGDPETGFDKLPTSSDLLMPICWEAIRKYVADDTGFGWFTTWQGFTGFKHIKYTENTEMHTHCDHLHSLFEGERRGIPILTMIVLLNDDFKGGEFVLFDDEVIPMEKGDILLFPSLFIYPHTVQKITEGVRYSIASWVF
jgi:hypothetical protein